jgi:hypothetical protein
MAREHTNVSRILFEAKLVDIGSWTLLRLPKSASAKLPSRGMTMVEGTINELRFQAPLEPDGTGSHWLKVDETMREAAGAHVGETVMLAIEPTNNWPEPEVPEDLKNALAGSSEAQSVWADITPMARWDWVRWIGGTKQPATRRRRINTALSKLEAGMRRPCCFNRSQCTVPDVSRNGVLLESIQPGAK